MKKILLILMVLAAVGQADAEKTVAARLDALRAAASGCDITQAVCRAESGVTEVAYILRPSATSFIRCTLALPPPDAWTGRFWGFGNGGGAGSVQMLTSVAQRTGGAAAHTDMGTSRGLASADVATDFGHRATHLMTVSAKALTEAFYGRPVAHSYFVGHSTGGGQGIHEAMRYPADYDGIVAGVPANTRLPLHIYFLWNWRQLYDGDSRPVFSPEELAAVEQAGLDWFADKDPPFARGKFICDSRWTPEAEAGVLALAVKARPSLADPDKQARLRRLFRGPVLRGRHVHPGVPFGASFAAAQRHQWMAHWWHALNKDGKGLAETTDDDLLAMEAAWGPDFDAYAGDCAAFFARGGKLLVYGGCADSIVPLAPMCAWYDRLAQAAGGHDALAASCLLYLIPGYAHGPGKYVKGLADKEQLIVDWVEKGVPPGAVQIETQAGLAPFALRPYPNQWLGRR